MLTSFTIDATDSLNNSQTALSILAKKITEKSCPAEMELINSGNLTFCIDKFEASPSPNCVFEVPKSLTETTHNINDKDCLPLSKANATPWTFVAQPQAVQVCAKAGKRLPTPEEWFVAAAGTPDNTDTCNLNGVFSKTGVFESCLSGNGAYDMIGNVWEYVSGQVEDSDYEDRKVPREGYVSETDIAGIALVTDSVPNQIYNEDYFWSSETGRQVIMRGGFYGSKSDGGVYATHAQSDTSFASAAVGFRCVKDLN